MDDGQVSLYSSHTDNAQHTRCLLPIGFNFTLMPDPTAAALGLDRGFSHQRRRFSQSFWKSMLHAPAAHTFESFWKTRPLQQRRLTQVWGEVKPYPSRQKLRTHPE